MMILVGTRIWLFLVLLLSLQSNAFSFVIQQQHIKSSTTRISQPSKQIGRSSCDVKIRKSASSQTWLHFGIVPPDLLLAQEAIVKTSSNLLDSYAHLLQIHPITTKAITAAILASAGDAIAQWRSESPTYDPKRGAAFLCFGALYTGAFQHFWFSYMTQHMSEWGDMLGIWGPERVYFPVDTVIDVDEWWRYFDIISQLENPPSSEALAAGKVLLNQLVVIPTIYMPLFFAFTGLVSGLDINETIARARSLYLPLLRRNLFFWVPIQFLQFWAIPIEFQIPFLSAASLVWTVILSSAGGGSIAPATPRSQIVAYETKEEFGEEIVTVSPVEPGPVNQVTDDVLLEDVEKTFIPERLVESAKEVVAKAADARTKLTAGGLTAGLLAAAADEGSIGALVGDLINVEAGVGVAVVTALGAGLGLLAAANAEENNVGGFNSTSIYAIEESSSNEKEAITISQGLAEIEVTDKAVNNKTDSAMEKVQDTQETFTPRR